MNTLLLDLDNTLLKIPMTRFLQAYMPLLGEHLAEIAPLEPAKIVSAVFMATREMMHNTDPAITNADFFWQKMEEITAVDWLAIDGPAHTDVFYRGEYHQLQPLSAPKPGARQLIDWALGKGLVVVIATNPLYPWSAIEGRLRWAGVSEFPFTLVTHSENMHATKPREAYYEEILERVGAAPAGAVMVGDDWRSDIEPTAALGLRNFWIQPDGKVLPAEGVTQGRGELEACFEWLKGIYD